MHSRTKQPEVEAGIEAWPDEESHAARDRQAAASLLHVAAMTKDVATRKSLQQRAAELVSPRRSGGPTARPSSRSLRGGSR
jgi:hypothetical protein